MQDRHLCFPVYFFLSPSMAPHFLILESPPSVEVDTKLAMSTMQSFGLDPYFARSIDLGGKCVKLEKEWHYRAWN